MPELLCNSVPKRVRTSLGSEYVNERMQPHQATQQQESPEWPKSAVEDFVRSVPPLQLDESGNHLWSEWLERTCDRNLWRPNVAWRKLTSVWKSRTEVRGLYKLSRTRSKIIQLIVEAVYRDAEEIHRRRTSPQREANEANIQHRIYDIVARQRHHEVRELTLSRLIDFSLLLSAYVDCCLSECTDQKVMDATLTQVEEELNIFDSGATTKNFLRFSQYMNTVMQRSKWLPWYEEVPNLNNRVVIRVRDAVNQFFENLPSPRMDPKTGVRGFVQSTSMTTSGMDAWLLTLLDTKYLGKWEELTANYSVLSSNVAGEEEPLLEELSRRVVGTALEPLLEHSDKLDEAQATLADYVPKILISQSSRQAGILTFRMFLELYIYLSVFRTRLVELFYTKGLPSPNKIHLAVVLFEQLVGRIAEIRYMLRPEQNMVLMQWSMSSIEKPMTPLPFAAPQSPLECLQYKKTAIGAVLGRVFIRFSVHAAPFSDLNLHSSAAMDPLVYAAVIAEWDPSLAANIIDNAMQINSDLRAQYKSGNGHGVDLYMYRRIIVCDAAKDRFGGDPKAAGTILAKLHPVWDVCESDKALGSITLQGMEFMRTAVERGNFEAATFYGLLISSPGWSNVRKSLGIDQAVEEGIRLILQALENGDYSASIDLSNIITSVPTARSGVPYSKDLVEKIINALREASGLSPISALFLGYIFSVGGCGIAPDCEHAMSCYEKVLSFQDVTAATRAHAINNLAILITIGGMKVVPNDSRAPEYLVMASVAGNIKAKTNLAAMYCYGVSGISQNLSAAESVYRDYFNSTKGQKPVCVMQKTQDPNTVLISQVLIDRTRQDLFAKSIASGTVPFHPQSFGDVLYSELLPVSRVL